jgi:hypothetical protein
MTVLRFESAVACVCSCVVAIRSRVRVRSDGHCSAIFPHRSALLCGKGRVCGLPAEYSNYHFVDAVTGAVLSRGTIHLPVVDTSGALVWRNGSVIMARSGPDSEGCALPSVLSSMHVCSFRYGVCLTLDGGDCHVLRFDDWDLWMP